MRRCKHRFLVVHKPAPPPSTGAWAVYDNSKKYRCVIGYYSTKEQAQYVADRLEHRPLSSAEK